MKEGQRLFKGYWWLPSIPDKQTAGILTVDEDGNIELELLGMLGDYQCSPLFDSTEDVIYGKCYDNKNDFKDISLFSCRSAITVNFDSSFPILRYSCRFALVGILLESMNQKAFFKAYANIDELSNWCPPDNISTSYSDSGMSVTLNTSSGEGAIIDTIHLDNGVTLDFVKGYVHRPERLRHYIESSTGLRISCDEISANDVLLNVRRFEDFLSVCTLSYTVERSKLTLFCKTLYHEYSGEKYYLPIELITRLYKKDKKLTIHDYLCKYADLSEIIHQGLYRFYSDPSILHVWNNLIDSLEKKKVYSSNDFLVVVQAVDGFSIRFRKEKNFMDQLKSLRDEFKNISKLCITDEDLEAVKDSRHYYSHILTLQIKEKRRVLDGVDLYLLTKKLRILLICCVLNFLGLTNEQIDCLLIKCNHSIL